MHKSRFLQIILVVMLLALPGGVPGISPDAQAQAAPYLDATLPPEERAADLLARMSLDEKIGQMTLVEKNSIRPDDITTRSIGGLLSGGGGYPAEGNTAEAWLAMVSGYQAKALATPLAIPLLYGVDAVHGHNNLRGSVIFPHNIGLGATGNPDLVEQIGQVTAREMIATGIYWNYAPVLAVPQDIRWGRTYEAYSEDPALVTSLGVAYLRGLQGAALSDPFSVLATPKHYIGDGAAEWGTSVRYQLDQGMMNADEALVRERYLPPYIAAIEAGARSVMVSFSGWNGVKMHAHQYLITDVLKGELGFTGFVVSDWAGVDQVDPDYYTAVVTSINAGVDMNMVPYDYQRFIGVMQQAVDAGDIPLARIDDAVLRILRVKFELGLFERPTGDPALLAEVGSEDHRALARQAVRESLVLLQNQQQTLPLAKDAPVIFVAGTGADDIGMQSGGWTIEWQGRSGNITPGTTLLQAVEAAVSPATEVYYNRFGNFSRITDAAGKPVIAPVGLLVVGELPYAEGEGDRADLSLDPADLVTLERMRGQVDRLVVILISGRPLLVNDVLPQSDALIAAWLPGTEAAGITDVLFGDAPFTGKLPFTWLRSMAQVTYDPARAQATGCDAPLFPFGYGLTTDAPASTQPQAAPECP